MSIASVLAPLYIIEFAPPQWRERLVVLWHGRPRFTIAASQELCDYLDDQIAEAVAGRIDPRTALDRTAEHWRRILTQAGHSPDGKSEAPGAR